jgi:hypothetical protein
MTFEQYPTTLEARLEELREARAELIQAAVLAPQDDARTGTLGAPWSIAEIFFHLHLAEIRTTKGLKRALESPARNTAADEAALRTEWERVRVLVGTRAVKVKAPPRVEPLNAPARAEAIRLIEQSRQELLAAIQSASYQDLLSVSLPHPLEAIGTLTGAGWLSVTAFHDLRHVQQIHEMIRS